MNYQTRMYFYLQIKVLFDAVAKMKSSKDKSSLLTNVEKNRSEKNLKKWLSH